MKFLAPALLALAAAPAAMLPVAPAVAQTPSDCEARIAGLRAAVGTIAISGKNADKDRAGLVGKLNDASAELGKGKNADAVKKLGDFRGKVEQLAAAGKIPSDAAASLIAQADSAIDCINGLSAG